HCRSRISFHQRNQTPTGLRRTRLYANLPSRPRFLPGIVLAERSREELFELYKIAIDEYRFEVKLNTDRMIHYIVANSALLSVATGLLKLDGAHAVNLFVALVFVTGALTSHLGIRAIRKGHQYSHRTYLKSAIQ